MRPCGERRYAGMRNPLRIGIQRCSAVRRNVMLDARRDECVRRSRRNGGTYCDTQDVRGRATHRRKRGSSAAWSRDGSRRAGRARHGSLEMVEVWMVIEERVRAMRRPEEYFERDEDGIRRKGHRIWLEDLLGMYLDGLTAEQVAAEFYTVSPEEVQAAIAYYETHRAQVEAYLERQRREGEERERQADAHPSERRQRLRALLRERLEQQQSGTTPA